MLQMIKEEGTMWNLLSMFSFRKIRELPIQDFKNILLSFITAISSRQLN